MLLLSEVREQLGDKNLKEVARRTGLAYDTVWRVFRGDTKRVSYDVVVRLSDYLEGKR